MKIILIRPQNPFFDSSASGNRYASLVEGLIQWGVQVTVIVTGGYNNPQEKKILTKKSTYKSIEFLYLFSFLNHTLWRRRINKYVLSHITNRLLPLKLKKILKHSFDYLWITGDYQILNFYNKNYSNIKKCLIEINEFQDIYLQEGHLTHKMQIKYAKLQERNFYEAIKHIDYFAFMTNTLLTFYKTQIKSSAKIIHLPMTVDLFRFENVHKKQPSKPYIAFAGSLNNRKEGIDILIRSFATIISEYPGIELRLAGNYQPDVEVQKRIITSLNIESDVFYIGELTRDQIPGFLCNAKILVMARPDSHQAQGGFPTKLGEYLATGNPVCVTRVGEIPDYLTDNVSAFMVEPGNVESLTDAFRRALLDEAISQRVGQAGYHVASTHFSKEVQTKRLKEFLENNK